MDPRRTESEAARRAGAEVVAGPLEAGMDVEGGRRRRPSHGLAPMVVERARALAPPRTAPSDLDDAWGDSGAVPYALSAMAHPVRHRLLRLLAERGELGVAVLRRELSLSKPAVAYHTKLLLSADLIDVRRQGRSILFTLRHPAVAALWCELELLARPPRTDDGAAAPGV